MKTRQGFVSNSSSSSFVILKKDLTEDQLEAILNHDEVDQDILEKVYYKDELNQGDIWKIKEDMEKIEGWTVMDNFDMETFLEIIGVPEDRVKWETDCWGFSEDYDLEDLNKLF